MTQKERVMHYIKIYGSITPLDAFRDLGITKLATVVSLLKSEDGIVFYQDFESSHNRFGDVCHYMRYYLDKKLYDLDMIDKYHMQSERITKKDLEIDNYMEEKK